MHRMRDPEAYRRRWRLEEDQELPIAEVYGDPLIFQELVRPEPCIIRTSAQFFLEEISLEEYFDRLIGHLEIGTVLHESDSWETREQDYLDHDMIAGCIRIWMQNNDFARLDAADSAKLKRLCLTTYRSGSVQDVVEESIAADAPLETLPSEWADILTLIAYARRHVKFPRFMIQYSRIVPSDTSFQHSPSTPSNRLVEIQMWTALIHNGWVNHPVPYDPELFGLRAGLNALFSMWTREDHHMRSSPEVKALCEALHEKNFMLDAGTISLFLAPGYGWGDEFTDNSVGCDLQTAEMLLYHFPLSKISEGRHDWSPYGTNNWMRWGSSWFLMKSVARWSVNNPDRLVMMKILLDGGCYVDDRYPVWEARMGPEQTWQNDTVLHLAAERGDGELVDLLLRYGAEKDALAGPGPDRTPAQRARSKGFVEMAERIERYGE
ncbi:hypothetical protein B0T14DRAFT_565185 [Immersiella caudata]|uniref:Uncharacterized protein n=1 Tax=Immersiella caudata TaxID=314043 RepID=A0AA39WYB2_9PEZI|nr:hypothetical protein B0T14DRAFT_565185 [Immersiella caudata]